MSICPNCNAQNRDGAKFCAACRTNLSSGSAPVQQAPVQQAPVQQAPARTAPPPAQTAPPPVQTPQAQGAICPSCGASNRVGARICSGCRAALTSAAPVQESARLETYSDYVGLEAIRGKLENIFEDIKEAVEDKDPKGIKKILVFQGNKGTGKNTVADFFIQRLQQNGFLASGELTKKLARHIKDDLKLAQAEPKELGIKKYLTKKPPSAMVIRESTEDTEFLHELIMAISFSELNFFTILLGTKERLDAYFTANDDDKKRIKAFYDFPDQTNKELAQILKQKLLLKNYIIDPEAEALLEDYIKECKAQKQEHINGHLIEHKCFEAIKDLQREVRRKNGDKPEDRRRITAECIPLKDKPRTINEILADLESMVGMTDVKKTMREIANKTRYAKKLADLQGKNYKGEGNHIVITGNPGTGKTTIVRALASLFKASGVIASDIPVEKQGSDLKAAYIGQSKDKVNAMCDEALGGMLFVDEAYSLVNESGPVDEFAKEALDVFMARLENDRDKFIGVVAGYPREMETFIKKSNPGMARRFKHNIHLPDYSADELIEIFERFNVAKDGFTMTPEAQKKSREVIRHMVATKDEFFGNAGAIRTFFEKTTSRLSSRLANLPEDEQENAGFTLIQAEDIPFDIKEAVSVDKVLEDLDKMVGMTDVKKTVREIANTLQMQQERIAIEKAEAIKKGEEYIPKAASQVRNNIIITGNPGTGKTTIVRTLVSLFRSIGLTTRDKAVECQGNDLKGSYIGQSKDNVNSYCEKSFGGILFIDEAYALVNEQGPVDSFAKEALEVLMARMENEGHKFITIAAGYQKEMDLFLDKFNPGMRSRFVHFLNIPDYTADELIKIFTDYNVKPSGMSLTDEALEEAKKVIRNMVSSKGPNFGNAREMRELFNRITRRQSTRLSALSKEEREPIINTIEAVDIRGAEDKVMDMNDVLAELDAMTGMTEVKKKVREIATLIAAQRKREDLARAEAAKKGEKWEPKADQKQGNHIVLTGNPGTGKTTITRTLAKLFKAIGALPTDKIIEINGNDLPSAYANQSSDKVNEYVRQAMGGIFFIDEAYVLANEQGPVNSGAAEAAQTLMTHLENSKDKFICIAAGYESNMGLFLDKLNPGMKSRFNHYINIADYTAAELYEIFANGFVKKGGFTMTGEAQDAAKKAIDAMVRKKQADFGNAREMRRLYEDVLRRQAKRVSALPEDQATHEAYSAIDAADIGEAVKPISINDVLAELDAMVGMKEVKDAVRGIANKIAYNQKILQETGKAPAGEGNNICITGNPGTGKTTIVRTLAKLFKAINLLPDDNPLEIQGADLKGSYVGQSKDKVNEYCRQAVGRIFFIDEAYSLCDDKGPIDQFANEAITVLLAKLENERDRYVCIVAGYKKEMDTFIQKSNPGMARRFKHYIHIPDYSADELIEIFERFNVKKGGFTLTEGAQEKAREAIRKMVANKGPTFGNAGAIRTFFENITSATASRVSKLPEDQQSAVLQVIEAEDIV